MLVFFYVRSIFIDILLLGLMLQVTCVSLFANDISFLIDFRNNNNLPSHLSPETAFDKESYNLFIINFARTVSEIQSNAAKSQEKIGFDENIVNQAIGSTVINQQLKTLEERVRSYSIRSVPAFIFNGSRFVSGSNSADYFEQLIRSEYLDKKLD